MLTTALILLPLAGALVVAILPLPRETTAGLAFLVALMEVGLWIVAAARFDFDDGSLQLGTSREWVESLGISYSVGFYGFSLWLVGATVIVFAAAIGYAVWVGRDRSRAYHGLMLFLLGAVVATFAAQDLLLFYVSFEAMLIPLYVLVGVWGGDRRQAATVTFVIYTMAGSLLMLASVVAFGVTQGTFSLTESGTSDNTWIFLGFAIAFAVKAPLFPFHGWLPLTYREAPVEVAAVLSAVVSKTAIYGFLRIGIPKFPEPADDLSGLILVLASAGLVYGSLLAFRSADLRGVIAYSSMAQMGLITIGVFAFDDLGLDGAVLLSVAHALISATMFLLVGMVERRCGTGELDALGGMARGRPTLATIVLVGGMVALAVPGSATFAGEFLIMAGAYGQGWGYSVVVALGVVLAAMYTLRVISAILHVKPGRAVHDEALDLRLGELALVLPLLLVLARALGLAGARQPELVRARPRRSRPSASRDRHPDRRLAPARSDDRAARCGGRRPAQRSPPRVDAQGRLRGGRARRVRGRGRLRRCRLRRELDAARSCSTGRWCATSSRRLAQLILGVTGAAVVLASWGERRRENHAEYYALLATAGAGMVFFVGADNLMTLFLGLEWFSLCLYILVAFDNERETSLEAGLKYLIVGGFGSAVLLFGSALVYGATGELSFPAIAAADPSSDAFLFAGLAMILAGLAFKVSAAPFHMWTPDVYQGAPTSVTAFMSAATKTAALVVMLRVLVTAFPDQSDVWTIAVAVLAAISLAWGNLGALAQRDLKRILAYSSISHAGFMLMAISANSELGGQSLLYYLVPYSAMSVGAFAVVAARERELQAPVTLESLAGFGWERPYHGIALWTFMLGMAGFPLTGGLFGKLFVFSAAYDAGEWWLVLIGVAATAISLGYYLNVVRWLYMRSGAELRLAPAGGSPPRDSALSVAIGAAVAVTVGSFFVVQPILDAASDAAASLPF